MWWLLPVVVGGAFLLENSPPPPPPSNKLLLESGLWALGATTTTYIGLAAIEGLHNRFSNGAYAHTLEERRKNYALRHACYGARPPLVAHGGLQLTVVGLNLSVYMYCQRDIRNTLWLADSHHQNWTLLTGAFCHLDAAHLSTNMLSLVPEIPALLQTCGQSPYQFTAFYIASAILSSFAQRAVSYTRWTQSWLSRFDFTAPRGMGASGVAMAVCAASCFSQAWSSPAFILSAATLSWQVANDMAGLLHSKKRVGFAAHLAGAAFGTIYVCCNVDYHVWRRLVRLFGGKKSGGDGRGPTGNAQLKLDEIVRRLNSST